MVSIGFVGCHEISFFCLKKICELSSKYKDHIKIVFNLEKNSTSKHSAYFDFDVLQKKFGFNLHYVSDVSHASNLKKLRNANLDILFIIGWHRIVPQKVLDTAKICLGIHSSVLPKDRGSSPINWQIIKSHRKGGVTLFHLTTGVDSGPIVDKKNYRINEKDNVRTVYFKAISSSIDLLEKNWLSIHNLKPKAVPQLESEATFNQRRRPQDGLLDWAQDSKTCYDFIRALTFPYPGAFSYLNGEKIFLWSAKISKRKKSKPGQILQCGKKIIVSTKKGCFELILLQAEGEPISNASVFSKSHNLKVGDYFQSKI